MDKCSSTGNRRIDFSLNEPDFSANQVDFSVQQPDFTSNDITYAIHNFAVTADSLHEEYAETSVCFALRDPLKSIPDANVGLPEDSSDYGFRAIYDGRTNQPPANYYYRFVLDSSHLYQQSDKPYYAPKKPKSSEPVYKYAEFLLDL